jgi:hypothetical protein
MVSIKDGLGRPLYVIDGKDRLHPYTYEKVGDDFIYEYPNGNSSPFSVLPFMIISVGLIILVVFKLFLH